MLLHNIVRSMTDTMIVADPDGTIRCVNQAALDLLGYEEHELLGQHISLLLSQKKGLFSRKTSEGALRKSVIDHGEMMCRTKDGRAIPMLVSEAVMQGNAGRVKGITWVGKDLTKVKQAEEQLQLHGAILEFAANAVFITDRQGRITWVNPSFTLLTGYSPEEAIGQELRILKSGKHDQKFYQNLWDTILSGKVWQGEIINRRKDGSLYGGTDDHPLPRPERGDQPLHRH